MIKDQFMINISDVPKVGGLKEEDGWVDMQVQFLIDKASNGSQDFLLGWTVLPPGAMHDRHRHFHVDEFWIVISGQGVMYEHEGGEKISKKGDVVFTPRNQWEGFKNTSDEYVILVWGWIGKGSLEDAGYEVQPNHG